MLARIIPFPAVRVFYGLSIPDKSLLIALHKIQLHFGVVRIHADTADQRRNCTLEARDKDSNYYHSRNRKQDTIHIYILL